MKLLSLALALSLTTTAFAETPTTPPTTPRVSLFGGYSFLYPNATATGTLPGALLPLTSCLCANPQGFGGSATVNLLPWLGVTVDGSDSLGSSGTTTAQNLGQWSFYNISAGPTVSLHTHHLAPFAEVLLGEHHLAPALFPAQNAFGVIAGGGLDLPLSRHFSVRLFRADYVHSSHNFGTPATAVNGIRVQAGVLFSFGGLHRHAPSAAPVATPAAPLRPAAAPVAAPAPLPEDTTLTLAASPATVLSGQTSTLTAAGISLQNRPLTYSFQTSAGTLQQSGNTALLSTLGLGAGAVLITANVTDTLGATAVATTNVMVAVPVITAAQTTPLGTISFARDLHRPTRVDNEAKAALDGFALTLLRSSDATLAVIGSAALHEPDALHRAALRAVDTKDYLVRDKGIDPRRISVYTTATPGAIPGAIPGARSATVTLIPAGASLDLTGLTPVDESRIHPIHRKPLTQKR